MSSSPAPLQTIDPTLVILSLRLVTGWLVRRPDVLHPFLVVFTVLEGAAGIGLMLGFFTWAAAAGGVLLSGGILLGAGWIGATCLVAARD